MLDFIRTMMILAQLELYQQINLGLLAISLGLSLVVCMRGFLSKKQNLHFNEKMIAPGREASHFPLVVDFMLASVMLLLFGASFGLSSLSDAESDGISLTALIFTVLLYLPVLIRFLLIPRAEARPWWFLEIPLWVILAFLLAVTLSLAVQWSGLSRWMTEVAGSPEQQEVIEQFLKGSRTDQWLVALSSIILAPIAEECFFRGLIYPCLKKYLGVVFAALLCGLLFGAIHMSLPQTIPLSVFGVLLCFAYERSQTLYLPIIIHAAFNGAMILIAFSQFA